jgi:DNA-damage-inducible protein J
MPKSSSMSLRIDPQVKADVEAIYSQYGLSVTEAINIFLHQSRNVGGLPFDLRPARPNAVTLAAMREGDEIVKAGSGRFREADDMLKNLKS